MLVPRPPCSQDFKGTLDLHGRILTDVRKVFGPLYAPKGLECVPTLRWLEIYGFHAGRYATNGCFRKYWVFPPNPSIWKRGFSMEKKKHPFWGKHPPIFGNTQMVNLSGNTLPETNIAHENPPFWWYLQERWGFSWAMWVSGRVFGGIIFFGRKKNTLTTSGQLSGVTSEKPGLI